MEEGRTSGEYATAGCRRLASFRQDGANGTHWNPDFRFLAVDPFPSPRSLLLPLAVDRALFSFFLFPFFENLYRLELVSKRRGGGEGRGGKKERREEGEE